MKTLLGLIAATLLGSIPSVAVNLFPISTAPIVLTNAGEYYLTQDLIITNPAPVVAIRIAVSNVVLNLNGRIVRYIGPADPVFVLRNGIEAPFNSVVRDGRVRGWSNTGIILAGFDGIQPVAGAGVIDNVGVHECGVGIAAAGGTLRRCLVRDSARDGFVVTSSRLTSCVSRGNETGFHGHETNVFTRCRSSGNMVGFELEGGNVLDRCDSRRNTHVGLVLQSGSGAAVSRSVIARNGSAGIDIEMDSQSALIQGNRIIHNGYGEDPLFGALIINGKGTRAEGNRLIRNSPNTIVDNGIDSEIVDNIFVPRIH